MLVNLHLLWAFRAVHCWTNGLRQPEWSIDNPGIPIYHTGLSNVASMSYATRIRINRHDTPVPARKRDKKGPWEMTASGPLTGVKVIEFAGIGPGPFAGMMLSDMGATVL